MWNSFWLKVQETCFSLHTDRATGRVTYSVCCIFGFSLCVICPLCSPLWQISKHARRKGNHVVEEWSKMKHLDTVRVYVIYLEPPYTYVHMCRNAVQHFDNTLYMWVWVISYTFECTNVIQAVMLSVCDKWNYEIIDARYCYIFDETCDLFQPYVQ